MCTGLCARRAGWAGLRESCDGPAGTSTSKSRSIHHGTCTPSLAPTPIASSIYLAGLRGRQASSNASRLDAAECGSTEVRKSSARRCGVQAKRMRAVPGHTCLPTSAYLRARAAATAPPTSCLLLVLGMGSACWHTQATVALREPGCTEEDEGRPDDPANCTGNPAFGPDASTGTTSSDFPLPRAAMGPARTCGASWDILVSHCRK